MYILHYCTVPKKQSESPQIGADATVYVWILGQICLNKGRTYSVVLAVTKTLIILWDSEDPDIDWDSAASGKHYRYVALL